MKRFPTIRNAARLAEDRRESLHLLAETNGRVASHVSLWPQYFVFDDFRFSGGYIEDVATDPLDLGRGLAQEGMRAAAAVARERGLEMLGLATGLKGYYERLGWLPWHGNHTFHIAERNAAYPDQPLYLFPLSAAAKKVAASDGPMRSWRLRRFGDVPEVFRG
ncbi:MAG: GNAT family N-acetyltransferase [bacterium]